MSRPPKSRKGGLCSERVKKRSACVRVTVICRPQPASLSSVSALDSPGRLKKKQHLRSDRSLFQAFRLCGAAKRGARENFTPGTGNGRGGPRQNTIQRTRCDCRKSWRDIQLSLEDWLPVSFGSLVVFKNFWRTKSG